MTEQDFKRGFRFEMKTCNFPEVWELMWLHPNVCIELIEDIKKTFRQMPEYFREVK